MNVETFLQLRQINGPGLSQKCYDLVRKIGDRFGEDLAAVFRPFDETTSGPIQAHSDTLGQHPGVFSKRSPRKNVVNRMQIAAIGLASGAIEDDEPIHIIDACGGTGILSSSISRLRNNGDPIQTSGMVVDTNAALAAKHESFRQSLAPNNPRLIFAPQDIGGCDLAAPDDRKAYFLSKHPCGPNADTMITKVRSCPTTDVPHRTMILCCCHAKAQDHPPFQYGKDRFTVSPEEWNLLTRGACSFGWSNARGDGREAEALARSAMRIVDCLRVVNLSDRFAVSVQELLDSEQSQKNHGILIRQLA